MGPIPSRLKSNKCIINLLAHLPRLMSVFENYVLGISCFMGSSHKHIDNNVTLSVSLYLFNSKVKSNIVSYTISC